MYAVKFAETPQPSDVSRHLVEQLNGFVLKLDTSLSSAITSLGDALKTLLKIKSELLNEASRWVDRISLFGIQLFGNLTLNQQHEV